MRGERIRFVGGTHKGKTGWIDNAKKSPPKMIYVIVQEEDGDTTTTRVMRDSIAIAGVTKKPSSYEEACLQQHPDIDKMMDKLVEKLAMCQVEAPKNIAFIFLEKMKKANLKQLSKGKKALWYQVDFAASTRNSTGGTVNSTMDEQHVLEDEDH